MLTMNIYDNISPFVVCVNLRQLPVKAWLLTGQVCNLWCILHHGFALSTI
jgi:hypothetical protein